MKKRTLWLGMSFLLVASLVLSGCPAPDVVEPPVIAPPVVVEEPGIEPPVVVEEPVVEEPVVEPGLPQYGGTLTIINDWLVWEDPASPDIKDGQFIQLLWLTPMLEGPIRGDFEKYGPRGTGDYDFKGFTYIPEKYSRGWLLEDWEVSWEKLVWHVRPGIMWQDNPYLGFDFEPRELTAEDMVADLLIYKAAPGGATFREFGGDVYVVDRYTLVIEFDPHFDFRWFFWLGHEDRTQYTPPEMEVAGADKWENQVGTGPYMLKEYAIGSYMKFIRNPNYWKTTTIDGVEYQLPFIDEWIFPIIPDAATQVAALRAGKVDYFYNVAAPEWAHLDQTTPELLTSKAFGPGRVVLFEADEWPFDDVNARRAMMIGTDMKGFEALYGMGPLAPWHPYGIGHSGYIPLEDLPPESQLLYDYNPELASTMLREAGVPEGTKIEFWTLSRPYWLDEAALLKFQWAKIGIDLQIKALEWTAYAEARYDKAFTHTIWDDSSPFSVAMQLVKAPTGAHMNYGSFSNARYDEVTTALMAEMDVEEFDRLTREASLIFINEVVRIPLTVELDGIYWWPWLKNYFGEYNVGDAAGYAELLSHAWIDVELKAEMGY